MRRITKLFASVAMLLVLSLATSCETLVNYLDTPQNTETPTEAEYVTVSLGVDFVDLDVEYEPLSRAEDSRDLYGIQVYSAVSSSDDYDWQPFAYGLFDEVDDISINLLKGYVYKFAISMVNDGYNKLDWRNFGYRHFLSPFSVGGWTGVDNTFIYDSSTSMSGLGSGSSYLCVPQASFSRPNLERYYGELEGYTPGDKGGKAKIQLKRTSFGAKYIANGNKENSGTLEILMDGAPQLNLNLAESKQISEIYTFYNVYEAWFDNNYSETIPVVLRLVREDGTVVPMGTHNLTFKRNAKTVVHVSMDDTSEASGVGVEFLESGEMPDGDEVTIEGGEIVDTEVETNK